MLGVGVGFGVGVEVGVAVRVGVLGVGVVGVGDGDRVAVGEAVDSVGDLLVEEGAGADVLGSVGPVPGEHATTTTSARIAVTLWARLAAPM